jgi:hypothetical protein
MATAYLRSSKDDVVVIYYSGHGGLVESKLDAGKSNEQKGSQKPWRYQFRVPIDYDQTMNEDFRGILDVEISHMLRDTTEKTHNVTIILDCCHAGRMSRDPSHGDKASPRSLPEVQYHDISGYVRCLRESGQLRGETDLEGNPNAVRIAAAATTETAWEYQTAQGQWNGIMTEALTRAIDEANGHDVSWRITLFRVRELVNAEFSQQHPQIEGPDTRLHFSLQQMIHGVLLLKMEDDIAIIQAGRVAGVREGNTYAIMPFGSESADDKTQIAEARVTHVNGFKAKVELTFKPTRGSIPREGTLAFL